MQQDINVVDKKSQSTNNTDEIDTNDLKQVTELVYKRNAELVKLDRMKDEFVALVSHELRTPLTIVKNYLWLVANKDKDQVGEEPMKKVHIAMQSVDRLMALVEDTLTVSRLENGKITLKKEPLNIIARIKYILDIYQVHVSAKRIDLTFNTPYDEVMVSADVNRIHEVIVNILSNATKFTPVSGKIWIVVEKSKDEKNVNIIIKDSGPGIPKAKQNLLFTKFGKIDESYINLPNVNGTGLGLYISQKIMLLHDGMLSVESEYGQGATFIITLPIHSV